MNRREFLNTAALIGILPFVPRARAGAADTGGRVMSVNGWLPVADMGLTLEHEHLFADLRPFAEQTTHPLTIDTDEVQQVVLPHLAKIRALGCRTLIECTATDLGRNPLLVKRLANASGIHMLVPTGNYLAADGRFIPDYVRQSTAPTLAQRWLTEWEHGIGDTGVRPGFMKLGVNGGKLNPLEAMAIDAAAIAHRAAGLTVAIHVGPWRQVEPGHNAASVFDILERFERAKIAPSAAIWFHAQNEPDFSLTLRAARAGAFVSFDGYRPGMEDRYTSAVAQFKSAGLIGHLLISQDAGWYTAGEPRGGEFVPFDPILATLRPALLEGGLEQTDLDALFIRNPASAYAVRVRTG